MLTSMPTRIDNGTLVANTVYTSTFTKYMDAVEVSNMHPSAKIYVRSDGTNPVIGADDNYIVGPGETVTITNDKPRPTQGGGAVTTDIRLISDTACDFSVAEAV